MTDKKNMVLGDQKKKKKRPVLQVPLTHIFGVGRYFFYTLPESCKSAVF